MTSHRKLCVKVVDIWGTDETKNCDLNSLSSFIRVDFSCGALGAQSQETSLVYAKTTLPQFNEHLCFNLPDDIKDLHPASLSVCWRYWVKKGYIDLSTETIDNRRFRNQLFQGNAGGDELEYLKFNKPFYKCSRYVRLIISSINPYDAPRTANIHESHERFGTFDKTRELRKKNLMGTKSISALCGNWGKEHDLQNFHSYEIKIRLRGEEPSFVLLLGTKLNDDVGNKKFDLTLISKIVECSIFYGGEVSVDADHMSKAKCFHELFFNAIFGEVFISVSGNQELLFGTDQCLWDNSHLYLLLPMDTRTRGVNWTEIESCNSVVNYLKENVYGLLTAESSEKTKSLFDDRVISDDFRNTTLLRLANKSVRRTDVNDMVVMTIHTGRIYHVVDVIDISSSEDADGTQSFDYDSFNEKYGISLLLPRQPLLLLKRCDHPHSLLVDFKEEGPKYPEGDGIETNVLMPPELLVCIDVRTEVLKAFYLLPSVMHRLESLMLASQLREEIASHSSDLQISTSLILEALTSRRCNENFSMERLKLLGKSVLKYAVRCNHFLSYPRGDIEDLYRLHSDAVWIPKMHRLGHKKLQGYIRDSPFDPLRWTGPGQRSIRVSPCDHGVETLDVPPNFKVSEDPLHVIGISCTNGHKWIDHETIINCVEALIGASYASGGFISTLHFLKWLGVDIDVKPHLIKEIIENASPPCCVPENYDTENLEIKLKYNFSVKQLLSDAITFVNLTPLGRQVWYIEEHSHYYQYKRFKRLAHLGKGVMDILVTHHLYKNHSISDAEELNDLRSAFLDKVNFGYALVKKNLHQHIHHHCSEELMTQIQAFARGVNDSYCGIRSPPECPKALGLLVASIAGAILIDSKLSLEEVWRIFEPILSPMTPDKLELQPMRELTKLCESLGCLLQINNTAKGDMVHVELKLRLKDALLVSDGDGQNLKAAKGKAALKLLKHLENRGISLSKKPRREFYDVPVVPHIPQKKRGPRRSLFNLCEEAHWPMPKFQISREPIEFDKPLEKRVGFSVCFKSHISLITGFGSLEIDGEKTAYKKTAHDSAALLMLVELARQGRIEISKW